MEDNVAPAHVHSASSEPLYTQVLPINNTINHHNIKITLDDMMCGVFGDKEPVRPWTVGEGCRSRCHNNIRRG